MGLGADLDGHGRVAPPPTGVRAPYRPAGSEVPYRLRYLCRTLYLGTQHSAPSLRVAVGRSEKHEVRPVLLSYFEINITEMCMETVSRKS